jgi:hypothetical protein
MNNGILIVHTENDEQSNALKALLKVMKLKFEDIAINAYSPEFEKKLRKSIAQADRDEVATIATENLWK